jgi:signal recognition particle GTPase
MEAEELNFETFYSQAKGHGNMGPLKNIFGMMGAPDVPKEMVEQGEEKAEEIQGHNIIDDKRGAQEREASS